jgi:predicted O-methyltransferase YrrM
MKLFYNPSDDMGPHTELIYTIVKNMSPDVTLEIGVRSGVSTKALMRGISDAEKKGCYHGCDINKVQLPSICKDSFLHIMLSDELAKTWTKPIDILFIDGDHNYDQVKRDFVNFSKFVVPNGIIFFHDTYPPTEKFKSPSLCGTAFKIIDDLRLLKNFESITLPYSFGLTICRRLS